MFTVTPNDEALGATLGRYGVLRFPNQDLDAPGLKAIADYCPAEERLMLRCQVMATRVFQPAFLAPARQYPMPIAAE